MPTALAKASEVEMVPAGPFAMVAALAAAEQDVTKSLMAMETTILATLLLAAPVTADKNLDVSPSGAKCPV